MDSNSRLRVAVIYGGQSAEREVSAISAKAVIENLDHKKYEILPIVIQEDNQWCYVSEISKLIESNEDLPQSLPLSGDEIVELNNAIIVGSKPVDIVIPILHGPYGEDGTLQGMLEMANITYVGTSVLGSALCMNKIAMKEMLLAHSLPVVPYVSSRESELVGLIDRVESEISYPCFVKPASMGSSVGISKAYDREQLADAIEVALKYDQWVLVEKAVDASEIEVSVIGDENIEVSIPGEIIPGEDFYSYEDKYINAQAQIKIPANLNEEEINTAKDLAFKAYKALKCDAMARADLFLDRATNQWYINELNTIPGFTPISMFPKLFEYSGKNYAELFEDLITIAIERNRKKNDKKVTYR